jgi:polyisoprenoid-binding protein YceI
MKKLQLSIAALAIVFATSCGNNAEGTKVEATDAQATTATTEATSYKVDNNATKIEWRGSKAIGDAHTGTIALKEGSEVLVEGGKVTGGKFIFDFNTLVSTDLQGEMADKLRGHLLSPDFLAADSFPEGFFIITSVVEGAPADSKLAGATHTVNGNLTLRGVEKGISFPANVTVTDTEVKTVSDLHFDRTQWGLVYGADASLKDKMINKEIELKLNVTAKK